MKIYTFTFGVDGFGADVAPAYDQGAYFDYNKAFDHLCKLNANQIKDTDREFYEPGYTIDEFPPTNLIMKKAVEEEDWDTYEAELEKHRLTTIEDICHRIIEYEEPPFGMYSIVEIEIKDAPSD